VEFGHRDDALLVLENRGGAAIRVGRVVRTEDQEVLGEIDGRQFFLRLDLGPDLFPLGLGGDEAGFEVGLLVFGDRALECVQDRQFFPTLGQRPGAGDDHDHTRGQELARTHRCSPWRRCDPHQFRRETAAESSAAVGSARVS